MYLRSKDRSAFYNDKKKYIFDSIFTIRANENLLFTVPSIYRAYYTNLSLYTSYLTDSYIVFTLKMESVSKNTIFVLKMMVKSGLEKNIFEILSCGRLFFLLDKTKITIFLHGGISK